MPNDKEAAHAELALITAGRELVALAARLAKHNPDQAIRRIAQAFGDAYAHIEATRHLNPNYLPTRSSEP